MNVLISGEAGLAGILGASPQLRPISGEPMKLGSDEEVEAAFAQCSDVTRSAVRTVSDVDRMVNQAWWRDRVSRLLRMLLDQHTPANEQGPCSSALEDLLGRSDVELDSTEILRSLGEIGGSQLSQAMQVASAHPQLHAVLDALRQSPGPTGGRRQADEARQAIGRPRAFPSLRGAHRQSIVPSEPAEASKKSREDSRGVFRYAYARSGRETRAPEHSAHEHSTGSIGLAAEIAAAYVTSNSVAAGELPSLIQSVHRALARASAAMETVDAAPKEPAVPVKRSITPDHLICLEDGRKFKSLKRHLRTKYNMTPEDYRSKWGLAHDYPMVAPNYAKARSELARQIGLGQGGRQALRRRGR